MNDASERLGHRCALRLEVGTDYYNVPRWHGHELREAAGQTSDAMLRISLALVGVAGHAVLTQRLMTFADARAPLIDDDAIADAHVADVRSQLLHHARDLVAEYLRLLAERSRASGVVTVVVGRTCDDV
jgi:hypothetical protein